MAAMSKTKGATISILIKRRLFGALLHSLEWKSKKYGWIEVKAVFDLDVGKRAHVRVFLYSDKFPPAWDRHLAKVEFTDDRIEKITLLDTDRGWAERQRE